MQWVESIYWTFADEKWFQAHTLQSYCCLNLHGKFSAIQLRDVCSTQFSIRNEDLILGDIYVNERDQWMFRRLEYRCGFPFHSFGGIWMRFHEEKMKCFSFLSGLFDKVCIEIQSQSVNWKPIGQLINYREGTELRILFHRLWVGPADEHSQIVNILEVATHFVEFEVNVWVWREF